MLFQMSFPSMPDTSTAMFQRSSKTVVETMAQNEVMPRNKQNVKKKLNKRERERKRKCMEKHTENRK